MFDEQLCPVPAQLVNGVLLPDGWHDVTEFTLGAWLDVEPWPREDGFEAVTSEGRIIVGPAGTILALRYG